ncbi:MAG: hypothetical protein RL757_2501 [Bacteroidota bacterium]|jgi:hypothetical protein
MTAHNYFLEICEAIPDAKKGAMFGWECYKCGTKPFAFFDRNTEAAVAFKLSGEVYNEALALPDSEIFNPADKGKPMKNWVVVSFAQKSYWACFAMAAFEEVLKEPIKIKAKNGKK